jgi:hypothetical protein
LVVGCGHLKREKEKREKGEEKGGKKGKGKRRE